MRVCIDLGGTNIRISLTDNNKILFKDVYSTNPNDPKENLDQIYNFIEGIEYDDLKIFLCCPGPLSEENDMIIGTPNLPGWNFYPFKKEIENKLGIKVVIINDANAATIGEANIYSEYDNVLYFTISTGFGGGFSQRKKIYNGEYNTAFEIKDYIVSPPKNLNYGNLRGIENFCSGTAIYRLALENDLQVNNAKEVFDLVKIGNEKAIEILDFTRDTLVKFLKNCCYMLNPGVIVLGGSVILHNIDYFNTIERDFYFGNDSLVVRTKLKMADSNGESGLIGLMNFEE